MDRHVRYMTKLNVKIERVWGMDVSSSFTKLVMENLRMDDIAYLEWRIAGSWKEEKRYPQHLANGTKHGIIATLSVREFTCFIFWF